MSSGTTIAKLGSREEWLVSCMAVHVWRTHEWIAA